MNKILCALAAVGLLVGCGCSAKSQKSYALKTIALVLLLANSLTFANDAQFVIGRNDEIINVESKNITMREEEIIITLRKDYYEVDVTFNFFNNGPQEGVQLGFPIRYLYNRTQDKEPYDFKSYINGKAVTHIVKVDSSDTLESGIRWQKIWYVRDVTFPANSQTVSRVTYKSKYSTDPPGFRAGYIYGTGKFWQGAIGKMDIVINHGDDVLINNIGFGANVLKKNINADSSKFIWEENGKYRWIFKNVKPKSKWEYILIDVQPFNIYGKYGGEFGVSEDNYQDIDVKCSEGFDSDEYLGFSWYWDVCLLYKDQKEIRFYTKNQIRLFINFFFAIHGYDFKDPQYKEYFGQIENFGDRNKTRYKVNPDFSVSNFNDIERKNKDYLLNLEKKIPK
jgi:hypothetical protein